MKVKLEHKVRMPEATCPSCQKKVDGASGVTGARHPKPDDLSVCIFCAGVSQYDAEMQLKPFDMSVLTSDERREVEQAQQLVRRALAKKN